MSACSPSKASVMLREALAEAHYNQAGLARELGISQQAVSCWLCARCKPALPLMLRIEALFGIEVAAWAEEAPRSAKAARRRAA